jgi:caffeoyl-CoA O-methyltransferase
MSAVSKIVDDRALEFMWDFSSKRESAVLARLRQATAELPNGKLQISREQGRLMALLVTMLGAKRCIEIGVFTGYSALCVAERLPADGRLVACDVSEEWTAMGKPFWQEAGVAERIDLRLGPASRTLAALIDGGEAGTFDFAFIDADKESYDDYYEKCLRLLREGGVMTIDNIFLRGKTYDPLATDIRSANVRALASKISTDDRVDAAMVPIGDGVLLVRKC